MEWLENFFGGIGGQLQNSDWLPLLLALGGGAAGVAGGNNTPRVGYQGEIPKYTATRTALPTDPNRRPGGAGQRYMSDVQYTPKQMAAGGIATLPQAKGYYLGGPTDGMADRVPGAMRENPAQEVALSHGEFVWPADVVSDLGNGNSEAGAAQLYKMMDRIRTARHGSPEQGRRINPDKFMPK